MIFPGGGDLETPFFRKHVQISTQRQLSSKADELGRSSEKPVAEFAPRVESHGTEFSLRSWIFETEFPLLINRVEVKIVVI